jgi:hypothetical protein
MADHTPMQGEGVSGAMRTRYRDMGDGTYALVVYVGAGALAVGSALPAGTNVVGGALDAGPGWTTGHTPTNSADMSAAAADVTAAPAAGQRLVLTDLTISVDTAMSVTITEETSGTVMHGPFYMAANSTIQITTRGRMSKLATAGKKYQAQSSAAGNITVETWYFSEA